MVILQLMLALIYMIEKVWDWEVSLVLVIVVIWIWIVLVMALVCVRCSGGKGLSSLVVMKGSVKPYHCY